MEKLTLKKAYELHMILWDGIAKILKAHQSVHPPKLPEIDVLKKIAFEFDPRLQPYQDCENLCFACEYADGKCKKCPIKWRCDTCTSAQSEYHDLMIALLTNSIDQAIFFAEKIRDMPWKEKLYFRVCTDNNDPILFELKGCLLEERCEQIFINIFGSDYANALPNIYFKPGLFYTFLSICAGFVDSSIMANSDKSILTNASIVLYNCLVNKQ